MTRIIEEREKTFWYPRDTTPVRTGWYETRLSEHFTSSAPRLWTGTHWQVEIEGRYAACVVQEREWRGVFRDVAEM